MAETAKRIQAFETGTWPVEEHKASEHLRRAESTPMSTQDTASSSCEKRRKLAWFGHVTYQNSLSNAILRGTVEGGIRRSGQIEKLDPTTSRNGHPFHAGGSVNVLPQTTGGQSWPDCLSCHPEDQTGRGT